jgi:hypothetical protein
MSIYRKNQSILIKFKYHTFSKLIRLAIKNGTNYENMKLRDHDHIKYDFNISENFKHL